MYVISFSPAKCQLHMPFHSQLFLTDYSINADCHHRDYIFSCIFFFLTCVVRCHWAPVEGIEDDDDDDDDDNDDLWSGTGQTDGQTDNGHQCIMRPPHWGEGIIKFDTENQFLIKLEALCYCVYGNCAVCKWFSTHIKLFTKQFQPHAIE